MFTINEYAAKVICGESRGRVAAPGHYWTAVNIHNPHPHPVTFRKKIAVGFPSCRPGPITELEPVSIGPDQAVEIDCEDILGEFDDVKFVKGFAVIQSPAELDIVVVYTAGDDNVRTMDVERVPRRRMELHLPDLVPVPDDNGNFCTRDENRLLVRVCNHGTGPAGTSTTAVDFGPHGSVTVPTPPLGAGQCTVVRVPIPAGCFDPDCQFEITVNSSGNVQEANSSNNTARGVCLG